MARTLMDTKPNLTSLIPFVLLLAAMGMALPRLRGAESWTDERLPVREGLELWFDASRQAAGRGALQLPPLNSGSPTDTLLDGSGQRRHLTQRLPESRPHFQHLLAGDFLSFDGKDDFLAASNLEGSFAEATVFLVASPRSNPGDFRGFVAWNQAGRNDYTSGFNLDLGPLATPRLSMLNVEGAGTVGAVNLLPDRVFDFGRWHAFTVVTRPGTRGLQLFIDGLAQVARDRVAAEMRINDLTLGARSYSNSAEPPFAQGFAACDIAELIVFRRALPPQDLAAVEKYIARKYAELFALTPTTAGDGSVTLVTVTNPPPAQVFLPGFEVRELPVELDNINNVRYRPDGKLVALGYNGRVHLLSDTDGDGLEDRAVAFWDQETVRAPIGMALTPTGYAAGQGVFAAAKGRVALLLDTNKDDRADVDVTVATWKEVSEQQGVDALGVALDSAGNIYFSLGAASFTGAYQVDPATGRARYRLGSERGTIQKVSPDFQHRETVCTGIRFAVGLAFNRAGDLFCTDQEGATWLLNGNPLDELLHIQPGRHYGFPPRHPQYLPDVIDEPSVFDYAPQHQSTCGLSFNDSVNGGPTFGPAAWSGDAFVTGYSRGKLYRTKLIKTSTGYIAQNQLLACFSSLVVDTCLSPRGDLIVATHSGKPDWGSGPNGKGHLYRIRYLPQAAAQPLLAWNASPTEMRISFDRPLEPERLKKFLNETKLTQGRYVSAGDRFETLRPGYQVVQDQMMTPRWDVPILSAGVSADRRTLLLTTTPRSAAVNYAITLPSTVAGERPTRGSVGLPQHPQIDLVCDLTGVEAVWESTESKPSWQVWLPHLNLEVARAFTSGSAEHELLPTLLKQRGTFTLRGQLDLWQMLQPAVQPGSTLDHTRPAEKVTVVFSASVPFSVSLPGLAASPAAPLRSAGGNGARQQVTIHPSSAPDQWLAFAVTCPTGAADPGLDVTWFTEDDPRPRPFPLRRLLVPWALPTSRAATATGPRPIPELAGGDWLRGKKLFASETVGCSKCHRVRGVGNVVGPDLSNLVHRDYASVLKDIREPNAALNPDHLAYQVELKDGESLTGVLRADQATEITLADASGRIVTIPKANVKSLTLSKVSLMPEGLDKTLSATQLKDLMTFLLTAPVEPAALEIKGEPPARSRAEIEPFLPREDAATAASANRPFHILLCVGPKDHGPGEHDYPLWQKRWSILLALAENVSVETAQEWPSAEQMSRADVVAFYSDNPGWNLARARDLDALFERGAGAVFIHFAVDGHDQVEALASRIGMAWRGGAAKFRHGPLELQLHPHPLRPGLGPLRFVDETYWNLSGDTANLNLLGSVIEEGEPRPQFWSRQQGKGRVFVSIPGHYTWTFDDPLFRLLLLRGLCWAGGQAPDRLSELATIGARLND